MSEELISIIMPAYNASGFIEEALESVKNQTYSNWELIVVEDFSNDGTKDIVEEFKSSVDQNVVYHRNEINKGPSATRNTAASLANGERLAFLDSDDLWHKDHLLFLFTTAREAPNNDFFYSSFMEFSENIENEFLINPSQMVSTPPFKSKNLPTALFKGFMIQPSTVMVSTKMFFAIGGFDEGYRYVEDLFFYFKILAKNHKFIHTGKITSYYRKNLNGLSTNSLAMSLSLAKVREEILHGNFPVIDLKTKYYKTSEAWLTTARISRKKDIKLSKQAIKKAVKYNLTLKTLCFLVLIYSRL